MIPYEVEYLRAGSVQQALSLLVQNPEAKILAGGHTLLPMMKLRLARPALLVDIGRLPELRGIAVHEETISIGSATTHAELEASAELKQLAPLFPLAAAVIADPTVRNRGTIGGALVHADPSADWPAVVLAMDAEMEVVGAHGSRRIPAPEFFAGFMATAVAPDEILTRIHVPLPAPARVGYRKFRHPSSGYAVAAAAVAINIGKDGYTWGRIAITGVADTAFRAWEAGALLEGSFADLPDKVDDIVEAAFANVPPLEDNFADGAYRLQLGRVMLKRALADALKAPGTT
ncbi:MULTISPECIES: FAD binding domain-containing protein [Cupriavidus]|uniref:Xanthine dehydrogenase family protein subunit M n=1 Tax=Cupriavidus oxalaticus TaxID=96344 RepID=A0A4P7LM42_9BURK|nr:MULTISPECIES: xanthine dehydrogenase family protein subunit M [Cupriavidus]MBF6987562.1 xanthine dehydrogenase family protein subunit M [Cupriavidus sp. IK-TO18]QBY53271.1 xanthine dehydrogenase family protein subunit M [Cupriavidus oxalaticus]TDF63444.1 xanthine dehydrogenase family protein subunit M [Cupriavidus sp. L7L]